MRPTRILLFAGLALASGCYSYVPARLESVEPGQAVRVRLSPEAADRLESIRLTDLRIMDGVVVTEGNGELLVDTPVGRLDPLTGSRSFMQRVNVPVGEIVEIEFRERDNLKTGAAVGAAAVAAGIAITIALRGGGGRRDGDPGPGPVEDRRFPIGFRLAVPF